MPIVDKKQKEYLKDTASMAAGIAKTFAKGTAGSNSEKDIDYGAGPSPESKTVKPPADWYKGYGKYASTGASTGSARKVGTKKGRRKAARKS